MKRSIQQFGLVSGSEKPEIDCIIQLGKIVLWATHITNRHEGFDVEAILHADYPRVHLSGLD